MLHSDLNLKKLHWKKLKISEFNGSNYRKQVEDYALAEDFPITASVNTELLLPCIASLGDLKHFNF